MQSARVAGSLLAAALIVMAPLGAQAADLVVWWEKGFYAQEDEAVAEIIAAFEQETGKQVELVYSRRTSFRTRSWRRSRPGSRPTSLSASLLTSMSRDGRSRIGSWTSRTPSALSRTCSIRMRSPGACCSTRGPGRRPSTGCRWAARPTTSTSGRACWSGRLHARRHPEGVGGVLVVLVRPGAAGGAQGHGPRRHLGHRPRHVGRGQRHRRPVLPVLAAYDADYVTRDGRLVIDDPEIRQQAGQGDRQLYGRSTARAARRPIR